MYIYIYIYTSYHALYVLREGLSMYDRSYTQPSTVATGSTSAARDNNCNNNNNSSGINNNNNNNNNQ